MRPLFKRFRTTTLAAVGAMLAVLSVGGVIARAYAGGGPLPADPIAHALGLDDPASRARVLQAQNDREAQYQTSVTSCLRLSGFANVPASPAAAKVVDLDPVPNEEAAELAHGFGVTTAQAAGVTDPLTAFASSLPAADQQRFSDALNGPTGCSQSASTAVMGPLTAVSNEFDALETKMYDALAAKASVKALSVAWFSCMGRPSAFSNPSQISQYLLDKRNALAPNDTAGLNALSQEEMKLASADVGCRQRFVDPVFNPLLRRAAAKLVADNADVFRRFRHELGA